MDKQFVTYIRVSTQKQGRSGLGLEAQRQMCADFIARNNGTMIKEFKDVESGTHRDRKGLWQAIDFCRANNCPLVIAKLDRLARDVEFTFKVINTGIDIHFTDMPMVNTMILGVFASVAQYERELISSRTKSALEVRKQQGVRLGAASEKYKASMTPDKVLMMHTKKGATKNSRHLQSRDVVAFFKILKRVFPDATKANNPLNWSWGLINTRADNRDQMYNLMRDYREMDGSGRLFAKWDLSDIHSRKAHLKMSNYLNAIRRSVFNENNANC